MPKHPLYLSRFVLALLPAALLPDGLRVAEAIPFDAELEVRVDVSYDASLRDDSPPPADLNRSPRFIVTSGGIVESTVIEDDRLRESLILTDIGDGVAGVLDTELFDPSADGALHQEDLSFDLMLRNLSPTQAYLMNLAFATDQSVGASVDSCAGGRFSFDGPPGRGRAFDSEVLIGTDRFQGCSNNPDSGLPSSDAGADSLLLLLPAGSELTLQAAAGGFVDSNFTSPASFSSAFSVTVTEVVAAIPSPATPLLLGSGLLLMLFRQYARRGAARQCRAALRCPNSPGRPSPG